MLGHKIGLSQGMSSNLHFCQCMGSLSFIAALMTDAPGLLVGPAEASKCKVSKCRSHGFACRK